jgi:hypothetical protein
MLLVRPRWRQVEPMKWEVTGREPWRSAAELARPWAAIISKAGLEKGVVPYALRDSSVVRGLAAGLPVRLVAALHDTSSAMIERHYSAHIVDAMDELATRAIVQLLPPSALPLRQFGLTSRRKASKSRHKLISYPIPMGLGYRPIAGEPGPFATILEPLIDRSMARDYPASENEIRKRIANLKECAAEILEDQGCDSSQFADVIREEQERMVEARETMRQEARRRGFCLDEPSDDPEYQEMRARAGEAIQSAIVNRVAYAAACCLERLDDIERGLAYFDGESITIRGHVPLVNIDHPARQSGHNMLFCALDLVSRFHAVTIEEHASGVVQKTELAKSQSKWNQSRHEKAAREHRRWNECADARFWPEHPEATKVEAAESVKAWLSLPQTIKTIAKKLRKPAHRC